MLGHGVVFMLLTVLSTLHDLVSEALFVVASALLGLWIARFIHGEKVYGS